MTKNNRLVSLFPAFAFLGIAVLSALWMALGTSPAEAAGEPIVVIVNKSNPVDNLSMEELKKLFLSDRSRWDTGKAVAPVILPPGTPERTSFLKKVCGMSDADMNKYFMQAAFTGKSATPPKPLSSAAAVKAFVAESPGAIGFVKGMDFHGDGSDGGVKAVKIDGAAAGDAGYKLRM
ncbi:MAG: hypothetical protein WA609_06690 [Terriglobales bacterium]